MADYSGLTRDRHYGEGRVGEIPFIAIDTGGFEPVAKDGILLEMARQTRQAIAEADVVVFLVDARAGLNAHDHEIAQLLRNPASSACCWRSTRPRAWDPAPPWPSSTNWAWASRMRFRQRTAMASST